MDWLKDGRPAANAEKKRIAIQHEKPMYWYIERPEDWEVFERELIAQILNSPSKIAHQTGESNEEVLELVNEQPLRT